MAIKLSLGKLEMTDEFESIPNVLYVNKIQVLTNSFNDLKILKNLPFHHKDPFDRFIIAQAISHQMKVLTIDPAFDDYEVKTIW